MITIKIGRESGSMAKIKKSPFGKRETKGDVNRLKKQSPCFPSPRGTFGTPDSLFAKGGFGETLYGIKRLTINS